MSRRAATCGRWSIILQKYFGRDGREEADELLQRRSGDADKPRMLGAFNEATPDWLSFFMFTYFTDRDGKMQLESLAQSGFDPLSRTCRFMLTEEAHHMFVGETGVGRIIQRTCEAMKEAGIDDPNDVEKVRALGVIDLPTMQKQAQPALHAVARPVRLRSLDQRRQYLQRRHSRAVSRKPRSRTIIAWRTRPIRCSSSSMAKSNVSRSRRSPRINMRLRDDYTADCQRGLDRWNKIIDKTGVAFKLELPHVGFHRQIGEFKDVARLT